MHRKSLLYPLLIMLTAFTGCALISQPEPETDALVCPSENAQAAKFFTLGKTAWSLNMTDPAQRLFIEALTLDPDFCDARAFLAGTFAEQGNWERAADWTELALEYIPDDEQLTADLARAFSLSEQDAKALKTYKQLTRIAPKNPEGFYGLGLSYFISEKPDSAVIFLDIAEKLYEKADYPEENLMQVWNLKGRSYHILEDYETALKYLEKSNRLFQDDAITSLARGLCYLELGQMADARTQIQVARQAGLDVDDDIMVRAELFLKITEDPLPNQQFRKTLFLDPLDRDIIKEFLCVDDDCRTYQVNIYYSDGTLESTGFLKDGMLDSTAMSYYPNGLIHTKRNYLQGLEHGRFEAFDRDGNLTSQIHYKYGKLDGEFTAYHDNGKIREHGYYQSGELTDTLKIWYENGVKESLIAYGGGRLNGIYRHWLKDGTMDMEGRFRNGRKQGEYRTWHENGQLSFEAYFEDNFISGPAYEWYSNGMMKKEYSIQGKRGTVTYYDLTGEIESVENYVYHPIWDLFY